MDAAGNSARSEGERGASMVEFAIIVTLLLTILFGIIEFGTNFNDAQAIRQGTRAGAREGVVGEYGGDETCTRHNQQVISGGATLQNEHRELACLVKKQVGLGDETRVRFLVDVTADATPRSLTVCVQRDMRSVTGFFASLLDGRQIKARVEMRIERDSAITNEAADYVISEDAPASGDWGWC